MVLGFLRRRRGGGSPAAQGFQGPRGTITEEGYIPDPQELAVAKPIPPVGEWWNPEDVGLSWEEAGWPIVSRKEWKPKRIESRGESLREVLWLPGFKLAFHGMVWAKDQVYVVDALTFAILAKADGTKTAEEIVGEILTELPEHLDENDSLRRALEKDPEERSEEEKKEVIGFISALYFQMALLKKEGLLS